ncbi:MAG: Eco57I restriction-modification methylase domain-containing protein [Candidatus Hodarchaeota archaeon]
MKTSLGKRSISPSIISRSSPLHWILEFPSIIKKRGFDIIITNPPYASQLDPHVLKLLNKKFPTIRGNNNSAVFFLLKAELLANNGYIGMIIPKSFGFASNWLSIRNHFLDKIYLMIDTKEAFPGVKLEQIVVGFSPIPVPFYETFSLDQPVSRTKVEKSNLKYPGNRLNSLILFANPQTLKLMLKIRQKSEITLGDVTITKMGLNLQKFQVSRRTKYPTLSGKHIGRFKIRKIEHYLPTKLVEANKQKYRWFLSRKIIAQKIIAHVTKPQPHIIMMATLDTEGLITQNTVENTKIIDNRVSDDFVLCLINSRLMNWYAYHFIFSDAIRSMAYTQNSLSFMPLPNPRKWHQLNAQLKDYPQRINRLIKTSAKKFEIIQLEREMNDIIYTAYDLTSEEINLINAEFEKTEV